LINDSFNKKFHKSLTDCYIVNLLRMSGNFIDSQRLKFPMNTHESNNKGNVVCNWCSYDANPPKAKRCQKCGKPLGTTSKNRKNAPDSTILVGLNLLGLVLLLVGVAAYFIRQPAKPPTTLASLNSSSNNSSSDIRFYDSMKEVPNVPDGIFNYGGAAFLAPLTTSGTNEAMTQAHPNFRMRYTEPRDAKPGTSKGISMLLDGELSVALIGMPLKGTDYSNAQQRGFTLEQVPIAIDGVVFYTHLNVKIPGLSIDQLQDIYKGKLTNWKQVGGPDVPIVPFVIDPKASNLLNLLLDSEVKQASPKVQFIRDSAEGIRKVSSTPGGISFGGASPIVGQKTIRPLAVAAVNSKNYVLPLTDDGQQINPTVFRNGTYPFTRRLFIAIRRDGTPEETAGVAYVNMLLSKEGQQFVKKAGYTPLR
jgi:phosphate transport system substrate-binding protein